MLGHLLVHHLPLDPAFTAKNLGFDSTFANSIDAVSDRDYVAEALFIFAMIGNHLSRIGEEWTLVGIARVCMGKGCRCLLNWFFNHAAEEEP